MTLGVILALVIFFASLAALFFLFAPKIAIVASIDIEAIPRERDTKAKDRILYERMRRRVKEWESFLSFALHPIGDFFKQFFKAIHHAYTRLSDAREFQKKQWFKAQAEPPTEPADAEEYKKQLDEAAAFLNDERFEAAELKYIDLISKNKDGLEPYSGLIGVYSAQKEWEKARDVGEYCAKVYRGRIKTASEEEKPYLEFDAAHQSALLADIYGKLGENEKAFQSIRRSLTLQPNNPKYLDAALEIAILIQQRLKAEKYLDQLRDANPENQKIADFEERIKQLSY